MDHTFYKVFLFNIILHIEMSIVNLKIIFVKKQSTHVNAQLKVGTRTEMAVFTLETDYSCETGYPFDDSRQIGNTS